MELLNVSVGDFKSRTRHTSRLNLGVIQFLCHELHKLVYLGMQTLCVCVCVCARARARVLKCRNTPYSFLMAVILTRRKFVEIHRINK
jgi:hypothetical protein